MRLTGSFQTIVTQGVSGTASCPASGRSTSTSAGATLTGRHLLGLPSSLAESTRQQSCVFQRPTTGHSMPAPLPPSLRRCFPKPAALLTAGQHRAAELTIPAPYSPALFLRSLPLVTYDPHASTALLTDHYELTMLAGALRSGAASRRAVFEVFAR